MDSDWRSACRFLSRGFCRRLRLGGLFLGEILILRNWRGILFWAGAGRGVVFVLAVVCGVQREVHHRFKKVLVDL